MTNLEIMERGLDATYALYMNEYTKQGYQPEDLENGAHEFSAMALISTMNGPSRFYTRQNNLRYEMAAIGADGIKNELLKNVVNVAAYQRYMDTLAGNVLADQILPGMSDEQKAVALSNHINSYGAESAYRLLDNKEILESACRTFEWARGYQNRAYFEANAEFFSNRESIAAIEALDVYYARWGRQSTYEQPEAGYRR